MMGYQMRMRWRRAMGCLLLAGFVLIGACDDVNMEREIVITPDAVEMEGVGVARLAASLPEASPNANPDRTTHLMMPLVWSVNNPDLGRIASSSGHSAVYAGSNRTGQNVVFVKDQSGREGLVTITHK